MARTRRCPVCGQEVEATIWPRNWEPELVIEFTRLESRMACDQCSGVALPDEDP